MLDLGKDATRIKYVSVKRYKLMELSEIYRVSKFIMREDLKRIETRIGRRSGQRYGVEQVALIFCLLPLPPNIQLIPYRENR